MTSRRVPLLSDPRILAGGSALLIAAALWVAAASAMGRTELDLLGLGALCAPLGLELAVPGAPLTLADAATTALMWVLMMAAMMLPTAAPMLATYAGLAAREEPSGRLVLRVALFAGGYLVLWTGVAVVGAGAQLGLRAAGLIGAGEAVTAPVAAGLLILAGLHQRSAFKAACLTRCRQPLSFLMMHWRDGIEGAAPLGLAHGAHCVGCCAGIMGLMFVFGAMNLWWMALLALYCLAEKTLPGAERWSRHTGTLMILAGIALLATTQT